MSSFLTDNYDDGGVEIPLLVKPPPMSPSLVLNQAMARTTPSSSRKMNRITFSPSDVSRSISGSSDDGSDRYCADLACMEFFRSPPATATTRSSSSNKKRPLSAPTALQRRMSLPSLQNQMQSIIRLQAWWRRILAMQHYQTMRVCRQLLQQLQLQSTGSAYQELQQAVAALHVKTQQQLQQQDQRSITGTSHSPNQPSRDTLTAFHSSSLVGEEKKDDRFIQTKLSEDSSLLYGLGDDTSYISEDPLLLAHASQRLQQQQQQPDTNADNNNISSHLRQNRKPTKEMMALDTIYALQLALDNTDPDSQLYFSRQELMSPHRDVIARQQQQQKQVSPQQSSQGDSQGEEDIFHSPLPDVSNILESATSESFDDCHSDENESVHDISLAMDDRNVSTSSAYNVLRFFGFVQDKVIEEEVFHTENVYHDIMDSEGQDVIKELDELFAVAEEEDQVSVVHELQSPTAALDPSFYQSLDDTSFFHSLNETRVATPLKMYSQNEARAAKVIQDWWRQLVLRRKWETLRVCSTILRTVQYASHATPISSYSYPPQPTVENSYPATFYPELQHAIQWLKAKTHRQVSVRNYLKQSLQKEVACQKIQKWFRTCSRRRNLELQRRQQLEAEYHENSLFLAALAIQDWWRGVDLKRHAKQRRVFLRQRLERRDSLRKIEEAKRDEHRRRERAAKVLQGWWRVCQMQQIMTDIERISERGRSSSSLLLEEALADDVSSIASSASDGGDAEIQKWALERQRLAEQRYMTLVNSCQIIQQTWRAGMRRQVARKRRKMAIDAISRTENGIYTYPITLAAVQDH
ncbi:expressed unknown protein [Seminavis robusta]|uniref:Uncharacterized protein n=1 Tax=Seminavis robusta TaxID=568900 RepID=A0A9N8DTW4_9STRA|nr:expressed unknown protein [Seminavis robusta]|eukprot:Sro348_g123210.1 n/a (808) ;mRNA; r:31419-34051